MAVQLPKTAAIGYDGREHYEVVQALVGRLGATRRVPDAVLAELSAAHVRVLAGGLDWVLAGEAASDAFLRFLSQGRRGALRLRDDEQLPEAAVRAVRDFGVGAASLATLAAASSTPDHFVTLLSATEDAPFWDDRRRELFEAALERSPTGPALSTQQDFGGVGAGETFPNGPPASPEAPPAEGQAVSVGRAVERCLYRKLTGADREEFQSGLGAWDPAARRALARATAVELWGTDRLDKADARIHYLAAAAAIRAVLTGWARAQTDGLSLKDTPWIELANGVSLVFPKADHPDCDWIAANDLLAAITATDPVAAELFALHFFAGLGSEHVGLLTGVDREEVRSRCASVLERLMLRARGSAR